MRSPLAPITNSAPADVAVAGRKSGRPQWSDARLEVHDVTLVEPVAQIATYSIAVRLTVEKGSRPLTWSCVKRYSEFDKLDYVLRETDGYEPGVALPPKYARHTHPCLRTRAAGLAAYLRSMPPGYHAYSPTLADFYGLAQHASPAKIATHKIQLQREDRAARTLQVAGRRLVLKSLDARDFSTRQPPTGRALVCALLSCVTLLLLTWHRSLLVSARVENSGTPILYEQRHSLTDVSPSRAPSFWVDGSSCLEVVDLSLPRGERLVITAFDRHQIASPRSSRRDARQEQARQLSRRVVGSGSAARVFYGPALFELSLSNPGAAAARDTTQLSTRGGAPPSSWSAQVRVVSRFLPSDRLHDPAHPMLSGQQGISHRLARRERKSSPLLLPPPLMQSLAKVAPSALLRELRKRRRRASAESLYSTLRKLSDDQEAEQLCQRSHSRTRRACARLRGSNVESGMVMEGEVYEMCMALIHACGDNAADASE